MLTRTYLSLFLPPSWQHDSPIADELERSSRTVYAALVRLEALGHVRSRWRVPKAKGERPRRVYTITAKGRRALKA